MTADLKVLFVCVHNAARSRMAEAVLRAPCHFSTGIAHVNEHANPLVRPGSCAP